MKRSHSKLKRDSLRQTGQRENSNVNIATLKAELSKYIKLVKSGEEVIVTEHKTPVARIIPFEAGSPLESIKPRGSFSETIKKLKIPPLEREPSVDSLTLLREERGKR